MDENKKSLSLVRNLIRSGKVNSLNALKGTVDVLFEDRDKIIAKDLPYFSFEYNMPKIGDQVVCLFLGNGIEQGFCLGGFYSDVNPPPATDKNIYRKKLDDDTFVEYNKVSKSLKVSVEQVDILVSGGKVTVKAEEILLGDSASEGIPLGDQLKSWLDEHTHAITWTDAAGSGVSSSPSSSSPAPSLKVKTE